MELDVHRLESQIPTNLRSKSGKFLGHTLYILIATPGRLCDLMDKPDILTLGRVKYTVIDEADEMLDMDWSEENMDIDNHSEHDAHVSTFPLPIKSKL